MKETGKAKPVMDEVEKTKLKRELRKLHKKKGGSKHSVNFYLLLIIIVLLSAMVVEVFYFVWRYDAVSEESTDFVEAKREVEGQLNQCQTDLLKTIDQINILSEDLNISSASRSSLNELYEDLSDIRTQLETNLSNVESSLGTCRLELQEYSDELAAAISDLNDYISQYNQKVLELQTAITEISDLETELESCETLKNELSGDLGQLEDCVDDNNCTACA